MYTLPFVALKLTDDTRPHESSLHARLVPVGHPAPDHTARTVSDVVDPQAETVTMPVPVAVYWNHTSLCAAVHEGVGVPPSVAMVVSTGNVPVPEIASFAAAFRQSSEPFVGDGGS